MIRSLESTESNKNPMRLQLTRIVMTISIAAIGYVISSAMLFAASSGKSVQSALTTYFFLYFFQCTVILCIVLAFKNPKDVASSSLSGTDTTVKMTVSKSASSPSVAEAM